LRQGLVGCLPLAHPIRSQALFLGV